MYTYKISMLVTAIVSALKAYTYKISMLVTAIVSALKAAGDY